MQPLVGYIQYPKSGWYLPEIFSKLVKGDSNGVLPSSKLLQNGCEGSTVSDHLQMSMQQFSDKLKNVKIAAAELQCRQASI